MSYTVREIAKALNARFDGDGDIPITCAAEPADADADCLALAMGPKYADDLLKGAASAAVLWEGADWRSYGLKAAIFVERPRLAMSGLTKMLDLGPDIPTGIHPTAVIDSSAEIGDGAAIGPFVVIGPNVRIGDNAKIAPHVTIATGTQIGHNALIYSGVNIGARVRIGDDFIAQPGAAIGADGFSFVTAEKSGVEKARETLGDQGDAGTQSWIRIHSVGSVDIGDNVEIGANTTVDRGTIRNTIIGSGTKLDNLVQIGHNVQIGTDCLLCGQVGVAGSVRIGNHVVLGGQTGVADNLFIADGVISGAGTMILTNAPKGRVLMGYPAVKMDHNIEMHKALRRLPRLRAIVHDLQKAVSKLSGTD